MTTHRRRPRPDPPLTFEALEARRRAAIFGGSPLTFAEHAEWQRLQQSRDDWVPRAALTYAWDRIDPDHGVGGAVVLGRPRRPTDDPEAGWQWSAFVAALEADRAEIDRVIAQHPQQEPRLREWLRHMEALGCQREDAGAGRPDVGELYRVLQRWGYGRTHSHPRSVRPLAMGSREVH